MRRRGGREICARAREGRLWAELQANPHDWARHVRDQGPRQLPDQQTSLTTPMAHGSACLGIGRRSRETPAEHHTAASWATNPSQDTHLFRRERETLVFLVILFPLTTFHVSSFLFLFFILVWSFNLHISCIPAFLAVKYPVYFLSGASDIRIYLLLLLLFWALGLCIHHDEPRPGAWQWIAYIATGWPFGVSNWIGQLSLN